MLDEFGRFFGAFCICMVIWLLVVEPLIKPMKGRLQVITGGKTGTAPLTGGPVFKGSIFKKVA